MLLLPHTAEYAMRAVCYIAEHQAEGPVPVPAIARALGAPQNYLSKILHQLRALGVLSSVRGTAGGYRLSGPASGIRLARVVEPFMPETRNHCIMGHPRCGDDVACGAHERWSSIKASAQRFFAEVTLADLMNNTTRDEMSDESMPDAAASPNATGPAADELPTIAVACACEVPEPKPASACELRPRPAVVDACHIRFGGVA